MDAALRLFAQKGFSGTRTKEIAKKAGISEALIFQHFKTKEGLYNEALKETLKGHPMVPEIVRHIGAPGRPGGSDRICRAHDRARAPGREDVPAHHL